MNNCFAQSVLFSALLAAWPTRAEDIDISTAKLPSCVPKVKTVAVFKNGLGFVFQSGETRLRNGWARLERLPSAALGTLWIGTSSPQSPVTEVVAYKEKVTETVEAINPAELLAANVGRRVTLTCSLSGSSKVEGTVLSVAQDRLADPEALGPVVPPGSPLWRPPGETRPGEIVLLRTLVNGRPAILSIPKSAIQAVELEADAQLKTSVQKEMARARIHVRGEPASAEVNLVCLEKGLVWSPSYRLNIEHEKTAELTLEAIFANDVESMENTEVNFVVGYPNFLYAEMASPLAVQQSVANFVQALMTDPRAAQPGRFANVIAQQSIAYNTANFDTSARPEAAYTLAQPLPGETSEDLYFYHKSGVTLRKGERAQYTLFTTRVPYEHVYQWEIADNMNVDDRGYRMDNNPRRELQNQVWHVLRLENTTQQPWTTAPAFTLNGLLPVGQDMLAYTPPGAKNTLKLTVATDIRAEQTQTELSRKPLTVENRSFDDVVVAAKLKITNWKSQEACVVVHKSLVGEVQRTDPEGKTSKVVRKLTSINPTSEIEWEFHLPPGQAKEISFQYRVLVYR